MTSNDVICNGGINPYHQPISKAIINVPAGSPVTAEFHHSKISWLYPVNYFADDSGLAALAGADPSDSADPVDPSHKGELKRNIRIVTSLTNSSVRTRYGLPVSFARDVFRARTYTHELTSAKVNNATDMTVTGLQWFKVCKNPADRRSFSRLTCGIDLGGRNG